MMRCVLYLQGGKALAELKFHREGRSLAQPSPWKEDYAQEADRRRIVIYLDICRRPDRRTCQSPDKDAGGDCRWGGGGCI